MLETPVFLIRAYILWLFLFLGAGFGTSISLHAENSDSLGSSLQDCEIALQPPAFYSQTNGLEPLVTNDPIASSILLRSGSYVTTRDSRAYSEGLFPLAVLGGRGGFTGFPTFSGDDAYFKFLFHQMQIARSEGVPFYYIEYGLGHGISVEEFLIEAQKREMKVNVIGVDINPYGRIDNLERKFPNFKFYRSSASDFFKKQESNPKGINDLAMAGIDYFGPASYSWDLSGVISGYLSRSASGSVNLIKILTLHGETGPATNAQLKPSTQILMEDGSVVSLAKLLYGVPGLNVKSWESESRRRRNPESSARSVVLYIQKEDNYQGLNFELVLISKDESVHPPRRTYVVRYLN